MRALRVGRVFAVQTALRVGNADVQCRLKTFWAAEGIGFFQYVDNGFAAEFFNLMEDDVPTADKFGKLGAMFRRTQPLIDFAHGFDTGEVVSVVARQDVGRCFGFAQVVQQGGIAFGQAQTHIGGALQRHQGMDAAVDFGMVVGALRHAEEGIDFGQQDFERAAFAQHFNHFARIFFHQTFRKLLPDAFGNQCVRFAVFHHLPHQLYGFFGDFKPVTRGKAGSTQDADGVFGEGRGNVAQNACRQIPLSAERVDNLAVRILRHRVDGQVAAHQVLLQRNVFVGVETETDVTFGGFALGAGEGVFFVRFGMEKHGKIFADRLEALRQHGLCVCADDHPIAVFDGQAQKIIADGAADEVSLHMLPILKLSTMPSEAASDGIVPTGGYATPFFSK
ncbi:Uncharacterised protein [Neisseria meningitidis]|nr:Uncharacterised protein [Neisseria meningitidis]